ncbi:Uma2 family endonuclease [Pseudanabaena sp. Chao 1811]|uniref:Uma2 family endonuclease n=1 Tax=Pseudanabaena sp. Chao 1811 TaxID=2963092 RepID=UPI0022F3D999|nr:Uma2 family endonuclease [Pseudanabaena sp. Chao 1811]
MPATSVLKRLFTVKEYYQMFESGLFANERVELIRGEIIKMSPIGRRHAACVDRCNYTFAHKLGTKVIIRIQNPVALDNTSEPEPDVMVLSYKEDFYRSGHPQPADVLLLIEVADSTVDSDRQLKIPLYAEDGIVEVWLVDINNACVEVYRQPTVTGYQEILQFHRGQNLSILAFPEVNITVDEILG